MDFFWIAHVVSSDYIRIIDRGMLIADGLLTDCSLIAQGLLKDCSRIAQGLLTGFTQILRFMC